MSAQPQQATATWATNLRIEADDLISYPALPPSVASPLEFDYDAASEVTIVPPVTNNVSDEVIDYDADSK